MEQDRDHAATSLVRHVEALKQDVTALSHLSRGWQPNSKGLQYVQMLMKDVRQLEARATALLKEIGHMDAVRNHFMGQSPPKATSSGSSSRTEIPKQSAYVSPSHDHHPTPKPAPEPRVVGTPPPAPQQEEPLPVEPEAPKRKKLDSLVSGLPKHLLDELRKSGME